MTAPFQLPSTKKNTYLFQLEAGLNALFLQSSNVDRSIQRIANAIEKAGADGYFKGEERGEDRFQVLAVDVAWVSPGSDRVWSEKGNQVCYCRYARPKSGEPPSENWYSRALRRYFGGRDAHSLLSFPSIYKQPEFIHIKAIGRPSSTSSVPSQQNRPQADDVATWATTFDPRAPGPSTDEDWEARFDLYRRLLSEELSTEASVSLVGGAVLAWIYVSPGSLRTEPLLPPEWGASIFLLFLPIRSPKSERSATVARDISALLSNLVTSLSRAG